MGRLEKENSPYLRHAAGQKVDWYPFSEEPFERARREDKPVFLSSGAVWCHWCHVQARECFENEDIARLLNENFISVKLDRDERPDIDKRYQRAAQAMGAGGGWPLSIFLTPEKKPFYAGTYFPPEDAYGRPGFKKVLRQVSAFYRENREKVTEYSDSIISHLRPRPTPEAHGGAGGLKASSVNEALYNMLSDYDAQHGGFGSLPKFPMPGAVGFILNRYFFLRDPFLEKCVRGTLDAMAKGGFYDQLGGGFHRYSTDEAWIIPHFEKMAEDNALLLGNYLDAYACFGDVFFREVAKGVIRYTRSVLSEPDGGFYHSHDADITPEDEGGYYTWTEKEFSNALSGRQYEVLSLHLMSEKGAMHHDPQKRVLFVAAEPRDIAARLGMAEDEVRGIIKAGKQKLLEERQRREMPFVDKTLYASLNGMFASAFIKAYSFLGDSALLDFAVRSLQRVSRSHLKGDVLYHIPGVSGVLEDYVHFAGAFLDAYEATGDIGFLQTGERLMDRCLKEFWDDSSAGFFDTSGEVVGLRLKAIEDIPHPSPNALAAWNLLRLSAITGKEHYRERAASCVEFFSAGAALLGLHSATYYASLDAYYNLLSLRVEAEPGSPLSRAARETFRPYKVINYGNEEAGQVVPCLRDRCLEALAGPEAVRELLGKSTID
jgi:uncharacterized protein YyaL (SSP411 family)